MKLIKIYFIGIFFMIAALAMSTFWQFQQFKININNLSFGIPAEFTKMPDINQELSGIIDQDKNQNPAPDKNTESEATPTKKFASIDGLFRFNYPSDWQEASEQKVEDKTGKILFSAYKTNGLIADYLIVTEMASSTVDEAIKQYKNEIWSKDPAKTISERQITTNQERSVKIIEIDAGAGNDAANLSIKILTKAGFIGGNGKNYQVLIIASKETAYDAEEFDNIFESITIEEQNPSTKTDL